MNFLKRSELPLIKINDTEANSKQLTVLITH